MHNFKHTHLPTSTYHPFCTVTRYKLDIYIDLFGSTFENTCYALNVHNQKPLSCLAMCEYLPYTLDSLDENYALYTCNKTHYFKQISGYAYPKVSIEKIPLRNTPGLSRAGQEASFYSANFIGYKKTNPEWNQTRILKTFLASEFL